MMQVGHYCIEGTDTPDPCLAGTIGEFKGLAGPYLCQDCITPTHSAQGSVACNICLRGYYRDPQAPNNSLANQRANCELCLDGATCDADDVDLTTLNVSVGHWRLAPLARTISECHVNNAGVSSCLGGTSAGVDGRGYCSPGHHGPLCELCDDAQLAAKTYYRRDAARCVKCPDVPNVLSIAIGVIGLVVLGVAVIALLVLYPPAALRNLSVVLRRVYLKSKSFALMPKLKIIIALYQMLLAIPTVYDLRAHTTCK
jgi:hypothetical protein